MAATGFQLPDDQDRLADLGRIAGAQVRVARDALRAWRGEAARARLRGQLAGLAGLPRVMRWRGPVQASRVTPIEALDRLLVCD